VKTLPTEKTVCVCAVVNCRVCEIAIALELIVVTSCKRPVNPVINPNPIYSHCVHLTIC
jgi:hypothetical protein